MSSLPGGILIIVFLVGFFSLIAWMFASARKQAAESKQRLVNQGFTPVNPQVFGDVERILTLYQRAPRQKLSLCNVYEKPVQDGQAYVFDLEDNSGEDSQWVGREIVAILSPLLHLPAFTLMPQLKVDGKAANFIQNASEKVIDWAAGRSGLVHISFLDYPAFDQAYLVFGRDETEVRAFLTEDRLNQLASLNRSYGIETNGDLFAVARIPFPPSQKKVDPQDFQFLLADVNRIFIWFQ